MWVNYTIYVNSYLLGRPTTIPEEQFPGWEQAARTLINRRHVEFDSADDPDATNLPPYEVQMCICEVAEALFIESQAPRAGELKSESNAGYSWSKIEAKSQAESNKEIQKIVMKWLAGTPWHRDFVFIGNGLN